VPELPEVQTVTQQVRAALRGRRLMKAELLRRDMLRRGSAPLGLLEGRFLSEVERVGKCVVLRFGRVGSLVVHLGMTGRLVVAEGRRSYSEPPHTHARLRFGSGRLLSFADPRRFGFLMVTREEAVAEVLGIAPDPFAMDARELARRLSRHRAAIKTVLLDQRVLSGLGNIYADEVLFATAIHPQTPAAQVADEAPAILAAARRILRRAIARHGTTFRDYRDARGDRGGFLPLLEVYGRQGEPCRRCGSPIEKMRLQGRGTHFCPRCQDRVEP